MKWITETAVVPGSRQDRMFAMARLGLIVAPFAIALLLLVLKVL